MQILHSTSSLNDQHENVKKMKTLQAIDRDKEPLRHEPNCRSMHMKWIKLLNYQRVTNDSNFIQRAGPLNDQHENVKKMKTLQAIERDKEQVSESDMNKTRGMKWIK